MLYKLKRDTIQNSKKLTYNFKKCETLNKRALHLIQGRKL